MTPPDTRKRSRRIYNIVRAGDKCWTDASYAEFAEFVRAGRQACMYQAVGYFRTPWGGTSWVQICTGRSFRDWCPCGEWESRVWDNSEIDLVAPAYCQGWLDEVNKMHGASVRNARAWLRNYVTRSTCYGYNLDGGPGFDDRYFPKSPDGKVEWIGHYVREPENPYYHEEPWLPEVTE